MKTRSVTQAARVSNEPVAVSQGARRRMSPASAALGTSPRLAAQRQAIHSAMGERASLAGRSSNLVPGAAPTATRVASAPVVQAFWNLQPNGKPAWVDGQVPAKGYSDSGRRKGADQSQIVWVSDDVKSALEKAKLEEQEELKAPLRLKHAARSRPTTRRRDFSEEEKKRLNTIPKVLTREDSTPKAKTNSRGQGKAHLVDKGLKTAGTVPLTATEQQDQLSPNKGRGNRISSKAPLTTGKDTSNAYGTGGSFSIKARKLERARLRGKPDAQNVRVHTTDDILRELDQGPAKTASGKERQTLKAFARKDREFHHSVDFHSPDDPEFFIPNRFLIRDDVDEIHDSDSESESEVEAEDPVVETTVDSKEETEVADETVQDEEKDAALEPVTTTPALMTPASGGGRKKRKKKKVGRNGGHK